jgi:hypothetical protein
LESLRESGFYDDSIAIYPKQLFMLLIHWGDRVVETIILGGLEEDKI